MRVVPQRPVGLQVLVWFGGFILGPLVALRLSVSTAPDSEVVQIAAVFGFALIFVAGTFLWMGVGIVTVVLSGLWKLVRGKLPGPEGLDASDTMVPSGYRAYVALGVLGGCVVGVLAGLLTELTVPTATGIWLLTGLGYGLLLWLAAHHGYLPFPEPE